MRDSVYQFKTKKRLRDLQDSVFTLKRVTFKINRIFIIDNLKLEILIMFSLQNTSNLLFSTQI